VGALGGRADFVTAATLGGRARGIARPGRVRSVRRQQFLYGVGRYSLVIAGAVIFLAPLVFIALTSLMTDAQALSPRWWPHPFQWSNYSRIFEQTDVPRYMFNTMLYAVLATAGLLLSSIPVAYALARLRWRGRQAVFVLVLATMMMPTQVTIVPLYVMFAKLHLTGTLAPLIVPNWFGDAFTIFLLRQFFLTIPEEYADAARVDGAGELQILLRVFVPLARPAIAAAALFSFLFCWNDFFGPLTYIGESQHNWTLSVALSNFRGLYHVQWNLTMAATVVFMLPVIVVFLLAQRAFVQGVTLTGVKG
jgi:multiple sugar transport system permease protein